MQLHQILAKCELGFNHTFHQVFKINKSDTQTIRLIRQECKLLGAKVMIKRSTPTLLELRNVPQPAVNYIENTYGLTKIDEQND